MPLKQWLKRQVKKVIGPSSPAPLPPGRGAVSQHRGENPHKLADVIDHYEKLTSVYREVCGEVIQSGRPGSVDELLSHELRSSGIEDGEHVLDAGCGVCGPAVWFVRHKQITVDAVTISPTQYNLGRQAVESAHLSHKIKVHLGDYHKLHELFPARTFDRVYFLESICHAESYQRVLASVWKVLKPGGTLYIKDLLERDFSDNPATQKRADEFLKKAYTEYSFALVQRHEIATMLEETGFKIELLQPTPFSGDSEDHSYLINFEQKAGFHWRDGIDLWVIEGYEARARKPAQ